MTVWALLDGVAHRNLLAGATTGSIPRAGNSPERNVARSVKNQTTVLGVDGYESVILWPYPNKRAVVPPITIANNFLAPGTKQPLIIRFNGSYRYFQPPNKFPGRTAHEANGTPLGFDIQSNNSVPLAMDAHQYLAAAIPIARCREITVGIENQDNRAGAVSLEIRLTDRASSQESTLYLGEQPIVSTLPGQFAFKPTPVFETIRFPIPTHATIRKFSEITVLVRPGVEHTFDAPKIAVQQFQLYPR